ncbi:MAG: N-acetyl-gamma-glutamyl-phosphate reductase [Clostridia bacterium]|nr:N-acetyl-gamma-glutamyl-phosphate reductase [Clostridia bacterium]
MYKVFIDGSAGTTGLKIFDRLSKREDISLITLPEEVRKDISARKDAINSADVAFLCLPDAAAIEAVSLIENESVKVIDTSTAHRTNPLWAYGFPELSGKRELIKNSKRIANPGCHASGFIALVNPLVEKGIIDKDVLLTGVSITGYTGGGKKMIAEYEGEKPELYNAPRQYGLSQTHKHLPEIQKLCGLNNLPVLCPIVSDYPRGMEVTVPLFKKDVKGNIEDVKNAYRELYTGKVVKFNENGDEGGFLSASAFAGKDGMEISVYGNEDRILLVSRFDNLGKGASGAAIQNMNILLGVEETTGLTL